MARKRGTRGTKHIDKEKERLLSERKEAMGIAIECNNEDDFMKLLKQTRPDLTREELLSFLNEFRLVQRKRSL